jgi:hypothetical protein
MVYDCQLILLASTLTAYSEKEHPAQSYTKELQAECNEWLLNDCEGPMAEILGLRLLAFRIAANTVNQAQIRWYPDSQTMIYKDIQLSVVQIRDWLDQEIESARTIFRQCLCLDLDDIPTFQPGNLVDNWESARPGQSFVNDPRNRRHVEAGSHWLFDKIMKNTELKASWLQQASNGEWLWKASVASEYEKDVQQFLERILVIMHIGSGQPARRPEFMGKRIFADQRFKIQG